MTLGPVRPRRNPRWTGERAAKLALIVAGDFHKRQAEYVHPLLLRGPLSKTEIEVSRIEVAMLSKCANPICNARFRYLHDGRLFKVDMPGRSAPQLVGKKPPRQVEHFWLCEDCAAQMTLAVGSSGEVITVPLAKPNVRRAAAS